MGVVLASTENSSAQTSTAKTLSQEEHRIVDSVETMFHAIDANDPIMLNSVTEPDFYLFDAGAKFDSRSISAMLQQMKASGKQFSWHVTDPDVHIYGTTAWVAYVDRGVMTESKNSTDMMWLESAFLVKRGDQWKLVFMHSTPTAKSATPS